MSGSTAEEQTRETDMPTQVDEDVGASKAVPPYDGMLQVEPSGLPHAAQERIAELERLAARLAQRLRRAEQASRQPGQRSAPRCVFSDLDGTLIHFGGKLEEEGYDIIREVHGVKEPEVAHPVVHLPDPSKPPPRAVTIRYKEDGTERVCIELPSLTSGYGYISCRALDLISQIRRRGCEFVLITGARTSTYLMRRATGLPVIDYEIIEGGGRMIRDPDGQKSGHHDMGGVELWDQAWSEDIGSTEAVHSLYRDLESRGWRVDMRDYLTSFRVDVTSNAQVAKEWEEDVKKRLPDLGLTCSFNLGKADVYPSTSGKANAVTRLQRRLHLDPSECVALFDDDNDIGMASMCGRKIAVSITHESVKEYVASDETVEMVTKPGILGTEDALQRILDTLPAINADA